MERMWTKLSYHHTCRYLKKEIKGGVIVAGSTVMGADEQGRVDGCELGVIEEALGERRSVRVAEDDPPGGVAGAGAAVSEGDAARDGAAGGDVGRSCADAGVGGCSVRACRGAGGGAGVRDGDAVAGGLMAVWSPTDRPPSLSSTNKIG